MWVDVLVELLLGTVSQSLTHPQLCGLLHYNQYCLPISAASNFKTLDQCMGWLFTADVHSNKAHSHCRANVGNDNTHLFRMPQHSWLRRCCKICLRRLEHFGEYTLNSLTRLDFPRTHHASRVSMDEDLVTLRALQWDQQLSSTFGPTQAPVSTRFSSFGLPLCPFRSAPLRAALATILPSAGRRRPRPTRSRPPRRRATTRTDSRASRSTTRTCTRTVEGCMRVHWKWGQGGVERDIEGYHSVTHTHAYKGVQGI